MRKDNGLTDRAYGHEADDNHKVILVLAINDTAKAKPSGNQILLNKKELSQE